MSRRLDSAGDDLHLAQPSRASSRRAVARSGHGRAGAARVRASRRRRRRCSSRRPRRRCRTASCCTSCRATAISKRPSPTSRFFLAALEGLSDVGRRAGRPAVPVARSRSRIAAWRRTSGVTSARARALHALAARHGPGRRRVGGRAAAARQRARAAARRVDRSQARPGHRADRSRRAARRRRLHAARIRPTSTASSRSAAASSTSFPAGEASRPARVHRRHDRVAAHLRSRRRSGRSSRSISSRVVPLRDVLGGRPVGATIFDYLRAGQASRAIIVVRARRSRRARRRSSSSRSQRSYEEARRPRGARCARRRRAARRRGADRLRVLAARRRTLAQLGLDDDSRRRRARSRRRAESPASRPLPAGRRAARPRRRLGRRDPAAARRRRDDAVRRGDAGPRRADDRAAEGVRRLRRAGRARRRRAVRGGAGGRSAGCRAASGCPTPACRSTPRPTSSRRSGARPSGAGRRRKAFLSDLRDLKVGDLVVHVDHGIGDVRRPQADRRRRQRCRSSSSCATPATTSCSCRSSGSISSRSTPARRGRRSIGWAARRGSARRRRVKKAMRDMAEELLKLYAARKAVPGHAFSPDSHWQQEFEDAFEYELTPDQKTAIADIKRDMESPTPMDRLLCGDVGYGKTEVAMRAAFKAVMDGKQVAFLAPTTVLAFQHQKTLKERFAGFPVRIEMVSRFRSKAEQKEALADLAAGKVDIIVGTHRLLSKDVAVPRPRPARRRRGAAVRRRAQGEDQAAPEEGGRADDERDADSADAEHVARRHPRHVDHRDAAEGSPVDSDQRRQVRSAGHRPRDPAASSSAAGRSTSSTTASSRSSRSATCVQRLVPEARVVVGHGQMDEDALERAMLDFVARKFDVLLATTIVENGLDIPNANTIIINRADRYGLSQLYQLRGRVGRSDRPAYAYLLIPPEDNLSPVAKKRLAAIKEFSDLGSGFRVAALDLEIRGAGNLLGGEQSGHIETVGFEMYMKLLEQTVRELKGEELEDDVRATVNLRVDLRIDESYVRGHEPAADAVPQGRGRAARGRDRSRARGGRRSLRPAARLGAQPGRLRPHPGHGRSAGHRDHRPRRPDRRLKVQTAGEGRSRAARGAGAAAARPHARPACGPQAEARRGRRRGLRGARRGPKHAATSNPAPPVLERAAALANAVAQLVDGAGAGRGGEARVHQGRDSAARQGRSARARAACSSGSAAC